MKLFKKICMDVQRPRKKRKMLGGVHAYKILERAGKNLMTFDVSPLDGYVSEIIEEMKRHCKECPTDRINMPGKTVWLENGHHAILIEGEEGGDILLNGKFVYITPNGCYEIDTREESRESESALLKSRDAVTDEFFNVTNKEEYKAALKEKKKIDSEIKVLVNQATQLGIEVSGINLLIEAIAYLYLINTPVLSDPVQHEVGRRYKSGIHEFTQTGYTTVNIRCNDQRVSGGSTGNITGEKPYHLVRGHIHRYWIKGELVPKWIDAYWKGNPEVGISQKHYRVSAENRMTA